MQFGTKRARVNPERDPLATGHLETVTTETILPPVCPMIVGFGPFETAQRLRRNAIHAGLRSPVVRRLPAARPQPSLDP
jgi:hypothetical protein